MDDERVKAVDAKLQSLLEELARHKDRLVEAMRLASNEGPGNVPEAAHACSFVLVQFEAALDEARRLASVSLNANTRSSAYQWAVFRE